MKKIFTALRGFWEERRKERLYSDIISPEGIADEAQKLLHLVELSLCNGHLSGPEAHHLQSLLDEMGKLILLTEKEEFRRLSVDRRLSLHESLQRSQEKVMYSIQRADVPTARMQ